MVVSNQMVVSNDCVMVTFEVIVMILIDTLDFLSLVEYQPDYEEDYLILMTSYFDQ